jgi:hypothetical protein
MVHKAPVSRTFIGVEYGRQRIYVLVLGLWSHICPVWSFRVQCRWVCAIRSHRGEMGREAVRFCLRVGKTRTITKSWTGLLRCRFGAGSLPQYFPKTNQLRTKKRKIRRGRWKYYRRLSPRRQVGERSRRSKIFMICINQRASDVGRGERGVLQKEARNDGTESHK